MYHPAAARRCEEAAAFQLVRERHVADRADYTFRFTLKDPTDRPVPQTSARRVFIPKVPPLFVADAAQSVGGFQNADQPVIFKTGFPEYGWPFDRIPRHVLLRTRTMPATLYR
jgi:hypothetical protein